MARRSLLHVGLGEDAGCDAVGDAEHAEQNVFVGDRVPVCVVDRVCERHLQPWTDAEAGGSSLERTRPEGLLQALAHGLEVDPQGGERFWVDLRLGGAQPAREPLFDRVGADAELPQHCGGAAVRVADQDEQHVLGADVAMPEPARLLGASREVRLRGSGCLGTRAGTAAWEQPHRSLRRLRRSPVPYFWCTARLETPSSAAICCQLQPSSRARRTCSSSTASRSARSEATPRRPISGSSLAVCATTSPGSTIAVKLA